MSIKKIIFPLSVFIIIGLGFGLSFAVKFFTGTGGDTNVLNIKDVYTVDDSSSLIITTSQYSTEYAAGERFRIRQNNKNGSGFVESEQYGSFYIKGDIVASVSNTTNSNCSQLSYTLSGVLNNPEWGIDVNIDNTTSYFCPISQKFDIRINSSEFGPVSIVDNTSGPQTLSGTTITQSVVLNNTKVNVNGSVSGNNVSQVAGELNLGNNNFTNTQNKVIGKIAKTNQFVNRNIAFLTRGIQAITTNNQSLNGFSKKLHYYDFSGQEETSASNENNKGKILQIGTGGSGNNLNIMTVTAQKTLIVKGGNIYINADITNASSQSLLVIVVKRDETNRKNGGNIYINPNVTNIDAVLIADGSILSYDGTKVLSTINTSDIQLLRKQLMIYGGLMTKNNIGSNTPLYGTDLYIKSGKNASSGLYNLENLRSFEVISSDNITGALCNRNGELSASLDGTTAEQYAFAGKRKCYLTDSPKNNLRSTDKLAPLVIEYNPIIQVDPPYILRNNF